MNRRQFISRTAIAAAAPLVITNFSVFGADAAGAVGAGGRRAADDEQPLHERLSHREHQVYQLLAAGRSVGEIAEQLVLSPNTVSTYRARVLEKIGVRNDVELALFAVRLEQSAGPV